MTLLNIKTYYVWLAVALFCSVSIPTQAQESAAPQPAGVGSTIVKDFWSAYHFADWALNSTTNTPAPSLPEATTFLKLAIENTISNAQQGVVNEDYPNLTLQALEQAVVQDADAEGKCYAITIHHRNVIPPLIDSIYIPGAITSTPLGKRGLSNNLAECYIDTALQLLRIELLPLANIAEDGNTISFPGYPNLNKNIAYLPHLQQFLLNQVTTDEASRALREEMAQFIDWRMIERPWNLHENGYMGETGCSLAFGGWGSHVLRAWLYTLNTPSVMEITSSEDSNAQPTQKNKYTAHLRQLTVQPVAAGININMKQIIEEDLNQRGRELIGSLPPFTAFDLRPMPMGTFSKDSQLYDFNKVVYNIFPSISQNILEPVELTLSSQNSSTATTITLTPSGIESSVATPEGGHEVAWIQERGSWYELNNNHVFPIPKEWEEDMKLYLARYAREIVVSYTTSEGPNSITINSPSVESVIIAAPTPTEAANLHQQFKQLSVSRRNFYLNDSFYWWAFYKNNPDLRPNLDLLIASSVIQPPANQLSTSLLPIIKLSATQFQNPLQPPITQ